MTKFLVAYAGILIAYLILDGLWLGVIAKDSYNESMGELMRDKFHIWPWFVFYLFYSFAILYLAIIPNINAQSILPVAISAVILGAAAYGAYNLTAYSIIEDWPLDITIKDWIWGSFVTTASACAGFIALKKIFY